MTNPLNRLSILLGAAGVAALAVLGLSLRQPVARAADGKATIGTWGVDLTAMDRSVKPGDDFFRYAGGTWMKNTQIPADRSRWGSFNILAAKSEEDVATSLEDVAKRAATPGSVEQKVVDYYAATSTPRRSTPRASSREGRSRAHRGGKTHEDVVTGRAGPISARTSPVGLGVTLDAKTTGSSTSSASGRRASACRTATTT